MLQPWLGARALPLGLGPWIKHLIGLTAGRKMLCPEFVDTAEGVAASDVFDFAAPASSSPTACTDIKQSADGAEHPSNLIRHTLGAQRCVARMQLEITQAPSTSMQQQMKGFTEEASAGQAGLPVITFPARITVQP